MARGPAGLWRQAALRQPQCPGCLGGSARTGHPGPGNFSRTYKINRTASFSLLKSRLQRWLLKALPSLDEITQSLAELLKKHVAFLPFATKPRTQAIKPHNTSPINQSYSNEAGLSCED
jgi:hypothetical protein